MKNETLTILASNILSCYLKCQFRPLKPTIWEDYISKFDRQEHDAHLIDHENSTKSPCLRK